MLSDERGFTLIELMIVILIMGILVGIAVPVFVSARSNAAEKVCQANVRAMKSAAGVYNARYGSYPTSIGQLVPEFMEEVPICPEVGTPTSYTFIGGGEAPPTISCSFHGEF
ncbi:prepilin-type N-terminal cleavage/methylation domain-containing protein [Candidatus Solincola tengchongensis]|uniref:competence type IV pilus major pilin ComGC n=1 Tax=Candidatus Solincola tengchongensis TaxID=2900693 RepID=UPI00257AC9C2|nr:prepilin-type N-terminal cleavage/methylation domain-containing protein [Candidatus Solincola tengchongensis]